MNSSPPRETGTDLSERIDLAICRAVRRTQESNGTRLPRFHRSLDRENQECVSFGPFPGSDEAGYGTTREMEVDAFWLNAGTTADRAWQRSRCLGLRDLPHFNRPFGAWTILGVELPRALI